jgi:DNA gyrase subunit B
VDFVLAHALAGVPATDPETLAEAVRAAAREEAALTAEVVPELPGTVRARAVRSTTGEATTALLPVEMWGSREMSGLASATARLEEQVGRPPFILTRGSRSREATTYEQLRLAVLELCREGVTLSRFKGLGEMNHDQLWETTMDPERRVLQRVTMEDEASVGDLFATLMGDKVEPRRQFIEQNARSVRFLDV